jgi:hypothetical protein
MPEKVEVSINDLGQLIDKCNNLLAATKLPVSASIHIEGLKGGIEEIAEELNRLIVGG